ncbi:Hypothetical protein R9X50_00536200 [Acrodontium crateriforme]|uniref:Golgi apparatus membrane protein TVP38 n=1 Tax=Acrodontium crateriforme TaxID=150365 RepID=A0AAQ3M7P2_9PEZI|nr:Hypothetical protein R9X50_00536200 [Acrodontium crateriforme]
MSNHDATYSDTARALASRADSDDEEIASLTHSRHSTTQSWHRRSSSHSSARPRNVLARAAKTYKKFINRFLKFWFSLTPLQRVGLVILDIVLFVILVLSIMYGERIFRALAPVARKWREIPGGWAILWALTFGVSFPPMIGYSTCVTMAGFVFGMKGWFIVSTATIIGSTCAFLASRTVLKSYVGRMTANNTKFAALSLVLKHDGIKLLMMIRLCPLPYSLSNGAISTIPTVTWQNFMLATAAVTPKLLLHIFIGTQMANIGEHGDRMDAKTKAVSYISIVVGGIAGIATGYFIYSRTKARAAQLEAEEVEAATSGRRTSDVANEYIDDSDEQGAVDVLRRYESDISLHQTYEGDLEGGRAPDYVDEFTDDEDANETANVFDIGDGESGDEDNKKRRS